MPSMIIKKNKRSCERMKISTCATWSENSHVPTNCISCYQFIVNDKSKDKRKFKKLVVAISKNRFIEYEELSK